MPDWYALAKDVMTLLTPLAVAWLGVRGSREFTAIREEVIKAKDAQLAQKDEHIKLLERHRDLLQELNSKALMEHLKTTKDGLEQYIGQLQTERQEFVEQMKSKDELVQELQSIVRQSASDSVMPPQLSHAIGSTIAVFQGDMSRISRLIVERDDRLQIIETQASLEKLTKSLAEVLKELPEYPEGSG